jgi:hypothetical protein
MEEICVLRSLACDMAKAATGRRASADQSRAPIAAVIAGSLHTARMN